MPKKEDAIDQMSQVRQDVRKRMDAAIAAILELCWDYRSPDFSFSDHLALQREANKILVQMSDGILSDSEKRAILALTEAELQDYEEDALEFAEGEIAGEDMLFRLDRHADHLKDLLAGWLAVAAYAGLTKQKTIQNLWTFLGNVGASNDWRQSGISIPGWGKGFQLDILSGLTVVGQDMINRAFQYARIESFKEMGAIGYRTIRQSSYDCPYCDEMCTKIFLFDELELPYHPRCVCKAVPVFREDENIAISSNAEEVKTSNNDLAQSRAEVIKFAKANLIGKTIKMQELDRLVSFTMTGIKEMANQPHKHYLEKNASIKNILVIAPDASFVGGRADEKKRNYYYRYYKTRIAGEDSFIVVRENTDTGLIDFYSIIDRMKE